MAAPRNRHLCETETDTNTPIGLRLHESRKAAQDALVVGEQLNSVVDQLHAKVVQLLVGQHLANPCKETLTYKQHKEDTANFNVWRRVMTKLQEDDKFLSVFYTWSDDNALTISVDI